MILDHRDHHLLEADTAMDELQAAAKLPNTNTITRGKRVELGFPFQELNRKQVLRRSALLHNRISSANLHIQSTLGGLIHLCILFQRHLGIQETMVRRDQDIGTAPFVGNDADHILQLFNGRLTGIKHTRLIMTSFIDRIMIDIDHIHALDEGTPLCPLHSDQVRILQCNGSRIRGLQNLFPVIGIRINAIREHGKSIRLLRNSELLMREQRRHTELGDRRENRLD